MLLLVIIANVKSQEKGSIRSIDSIAIHNVLLVEGLKFNLLSISQLCDKGHKVTFKANQCIVHEIGSDNILFIANRCDMYILLRLNNLSIKMLNAYPLFMIMFGYGIEDQDIVA